MAEGTIIFKRDELYEEVWSSPMTHLASKYGLSDNGLRKICRKLNIPTPLIGYWARLQYGKHDPKLSLPTLKYGEPDTYTLQIKSTAGERSLETDTKIRGFIAEEEKTDKITVQERLVSPHPLVAQTLNVLSDVTPDKYGVLRPWRQKYLDMRVSPSSLKRALRIMDAVIKAFEERTFKVEIIADRVPESYVIIHGHKLIFSMREQINQVAHVPTKQEIEKQKKYSWDTPPPWDYKPSSELSLQIKEWDAEGLRKSWSDSKKKRLEEMLNDFVVGTIKIAIVSRDKRLQREKIWEEERKRAAEENERRMAEETFIKDLEMNAASWAKSQKIHAFIQKAADAFASRPSTPERRAQFEEWVSKAKQYADQLDPFNSGFSFKEE